MSTQFTWHGRRRDHGVARAAHTGQHCMLGAERLSAAFRRWDRNRTLLHEKRRQLAAAVAAHQRGEGPDPVWLSIELECIDELCTELFAELMQVANEVDATREVWAALHSAQRE
jgi:hypothetical protein